MKLYWLLRQLPSFLILLSSFTLSAQGFEKQLFFPAPNESSFVANHLLPDNSLLLGNGNSLLLSDQNGRESWNVQLEEAQEIIGLGSSITGDTLYVASLAIELSNDIVTATRWMYDSEGHFIDSHATILRDFNGFNRSRSYHNRAFVRSDGSVNYVIGSISTSGGSGIQFNTTDRILVITVDLAGNITQDYALTTGEYFVVADLEVMDDGSLAAMLQVDTIFNEEVDLNGNSKIGLFHGYPDESMLQLVPLQNHFEDYMGMSRVSNNEIGFGFRPNNNTDVELWIFDFTTDTLTHRISVPVPNIQSGLFEEIVAYGGAEYLLLMSGLWNNDQASLHPWIIRIDSTGNILENFDSPSVVGSYFSTDVFTLLPDKGVYTMGYLTTPSNNDPTGNTFRLLRLDGQLETFTNLLQGQLQPAQEGTECLVDSLQAGLPRWWIVAESQEASGDTLYGYTAADGSFEIRLDSGRYLIRTVAPNDYYGSCPPQLIQFGAVYDTLSMTLAGQVLEDCSLPVVAIGATVFSNCEAGYYLVNYVNEGTISEPNPIIRVTLDALFLPAFSNPPWTQQLGDTLFYELPPLGVNETGNIFISGMIDCNNPLPGITHCTEARIYPDTFCTPLNPLWDGSSIEVVGSCDGDTARFNIINVGADMMAPLDYVITEDFVIHLGGDFQLPSQATFDINVRVNNGATYRLSADQAPFHPGSSMPSTTVEGCGNFDLEAFSLGLTAFFAQDQGDPFVAIHCFPNLVPGALDGLSLNFPVPEGSGGLQSSNVEGATARQLPEHESSEINQNRPLVYLSANPGGIGAEHLIDTATTVYYQLSFRKKTAAEDLYSVMLQGQLPAAYDLSSLRPGASSHPYDFFVAPNGEVSFHLKSPDGQPLDFLPAYDGWGGFVQFSIDLAEDAPAGTVLNFQPSVVMNRRSPILTNAVRLKVRKPQRYAFINEFRCQPDLDTILESRMLDSLSFAAYDSLILTIITEAGSFNQVEYRSLATGDTLAGMVITDDIVFTDTLTSQGGCDSIITYFITLVGVEDLEITDGILLFPNPAKEYFALRLPTGADPDLYANLSLTDISGRAYVLDYDNSQFITSNGTLIFQVSQLPRGLYIVSGGQYPNIWRKKLMVRK